MNVFLIPPTFAEELECMLSSLWWGTKHNGRGGIAWIWWDHLCVSKELGGMGFHNFTEFNFAMLGK
ncbi:hypothetical protein LINGRAHAP2_LOCUS27324 [Linum grandiflorum]